jgi:hypothetical protein
MAKAFPSEGEIYRSELYVITREGGGHVIRMRRTTTPVTEDGLAEIQRWFDRLFPLFVRPRFSFLIDSRDAPMVEDPALERQIFEAGTRLFTGFAQRAVLVKTATGKLQASRLNRARGQPVAVFSSEDEAMSFLTQAVPPSRRL